MNDEPRTSFSAGRKWLFSLNMLLNLGAVIALVGMVNYLAARHFWHWDWSASHQFELSPLTERVLHELTNDVRITVYFDKREAVYDSIWALLKEYKYRNNRISVESVDYERDPGAALEVKTRYGFGNAGERDVVIIESGGRPRFIEAKQLSELDISALTSGKSHEIKRTHFRGELEFTSAILSVTSQRQLKAYFLQGHGEHQPDSQEGLTGYSEFSAMLRENNILPGKLTLAGTADLPADCSLLIVAGPVNSLFPAELEKIDHYLSQGGRMLALFNYSSLNKPTGLEGLLGAWGVAVGNNLVRESGEKTTMTGDDLLLSNFGSHVITKPFSKSVLYMLYPRSVSKAAGATGADAPQVETLVATSDRARVITDIRQGGVAHPGNDDYVGTVPLIVAVEKGSLPGVGATRGSTRIVVAGESIFFANTTIVKAANRDFASHVINWLLGRNEMLGTLGPKPIKDYRVVMTVGQLSSIAWLLLLILPGSVLILGWLVWLRRRR